MRKGHKWGGLPPGVMLPVEICARWFCDAERINPNYPMDEGMRSALEHALTLRMKERR